MAASKWSTFLLLAAISLSFGCSGGTTLNVQNPGAPNTPAISIVFQPTPPTSLFTNGSASMTAVVDNDSTESGVDWSLNCPSTANCGSLSALHTSSGQATTYLPPASMATNTEAVSILAFASADHTKNVSTSVTVNGFANFLTAGTYIVESAGVDTSGSPYQRVAALILDGNGGISSGEQTLNFLDPNTGLMSSVTDAVTGGSYVLGADGRGTLTFSTADLNIGQQGVETFSIVALSSSQALLTKTDVLNSDSTLSNESSVGTMDLQTPGARVATGGYALVARGVDSNTSPIAFGGILNIDGTRSISGAGSNFDMVQNGTGIVSPSSSVSGTLSAPDAYGTVKIRLNTNFGTSQLNTFTAYVIDNSHLKLIETDGGTGFTVGVAIGQGSLTGTYSTFSGSYAFGLFGQDLSGLPSSLAAAGSFAAGGGSLTNGSIDEIQSGMLVQVSDGFNATYTVDPSGRVDTNSSFSFATSSNGTGPELVFYLTSNGGPVLVLDADIEPALNFGSGAGGVATGIAYPRAAGGKFAGNYGASFTQNFFGNEADATGQICVNGASVTCSSDGTSNTLSGTVDLTIGFSPQGPSTISGTFQNSAVSGRLTGTLSDINFFNNPLAVAFYLIDSGHGFFVETDGGVDGVNAGYLSFGYFSSRAPVCEGCP